MELGKFTKEEIFSQTGAWAGALTAVKCKAEEIRRIYLDDFAQIIFAGCGSTYYLSLAAAPLFQTLSGRITKAAPSGELLMYPDAYYVNRPNLLCAVSRSASTSETVMSVKQFQKNARGKVFAITNYENQPLTELSDLIFIIPEGQEKSVAQTQSFCSMYIAVAALAVLASGREDLLDEMEKLPGLGNTLLSEYQELAKDVGEKIDYEKFYFLGSGTRYGIACEANLKMKEMTLTHTEPFHFLEFRHGPKSMVDEKTVVVGMLSDQQRTMEEKVLMEMKALGAKVISIAEKDADVSLNSGIPEIIRSILYLPALQMMAYYRSLAKGLDPDNPRNLSAVIYINE